MQVASTVRRVTRVARLPTVAAAYIGIATALVVAQAALTVTGQWQAFLGAGPLATIAVLATGAVVATYRPGVTRAATPIAIAIALAAVILSDALIGTFAAAAVAAAAVLYGSPVTMRGANPASLESVLGAFGIGFGVLSWATLLVGLAGALTAPVSFVVLAAPVAILLFRRGRMPAATRVRMPGATGSVAFVLCVWATVLVVQAVAPEVQYDSLSYHLGLPRMWVDAGRIVDVPEQIQSFYYLGAETVFALAMTLGGAAAAKLVSLAVFVACVLAVYALAKRVAGHRVGTIAAGLFATTPAVAWQGTTTYVDVAATLFVTLGTLFALRSLDGERDGPAYAGILLGLGMSMKITALLAIGPAAALLLWSLLRSRRWSGAAMFGVTLLVGVLPWAVLRSVQVGDPVFPFLTSVFPTRYPSFDVVDSPAFGLSRFGLGRDPGALLATPFALSYASERFDDGAVGSGFGIGILLMPLALPLLRTSSRLRLLALLAAVTFAAWAVSVPYARYLMPALPWIWTVAAAGLDRVSRTATASSRLARSAVPALMIASFPLLLFMYPLASDRLAYPVAFGIESRAGYLDRVLPTFGALQHVAATAGPASNVLLLSFHAGSADDEDRLYAPGRVETIASPWTQELIAVRDEDRARALLRARGITHVYVDRAIVPARVAGATVMKRSFLEQVGTLEYVRGPVELYRLGP